LASVGDYILIGAILVISLIEAVYLFKILGTNLMEGEKVELKIPPHQRFILALMALFLVVVGIFPQPLLHISKMVALSLLGEYHV